jgi:nicotinamidase-related amidase
MKKYLLVVDMQNDFIVGTLGTKEALTIVPNVIKKIEEYDRVDCEIVFAKLYHFEDDYQILQDGTEVPPTCCVYGTGGGDYFSDIRNVKDGLKNERYYEYVESTVGNVYFVQDIEDCKDEPDSIEIVGLCTDMGVISNALMLKSVMSEVRIIVDASCCAGTTPEKHKAALEVMKSCQIEIINESEERRNV